MITTLLIAATVAAAPAKPSLSAALETFRKDKSDVNREAVILAARGAQPALPEAASRNMARGEAAFELAEKPEELASAVSEFSAACDVAPWHADAYYNLGMAQEKSALFAAAAVSFKRYLLAAPRAADAEAIRKKIYKLEFAAEKRGAAAAEDAQWKRFAGTWRRSVRGGGGVMYTERYDISRDAGGTIVIVYAVEGYTNPESLGRDLRLSGGELSYQVDSTLRWEGGSTVCATHSVRGTVSSDGSTLTLAGKLLPYPANRSERCSSSYGDTTATLTR